MLSLPIYLNRSLDLLPTAYRSLFVRPFSVFIHSVFQTFVWVQGVVLLLRQQLLLQPLAGVRLKLGLRLVDAECQSSEDWVANKEVYYRWHRLGSIPVEPHVDKLFDHFDLLNCKDLIVQFQV